MKASSRVQCYDRRDEYFFCLGARAGEPVSKCAGRRRWGMALALPAPTALHAQVSADLLAAAEPDPALAAGNPAPRVHRQPR